MRSAKTAVREVARVMGLPDSEGERVAQMIPNKAGMTMEEALDANAGLKATCDNEPRVLELIEVARLLQGLAINKSKFAAGVVIGAQPLNETIPLTLDDDGALITQFPMRALNEFGLLRMNILGSGALTVINATVQLVEQRHGVRLDLDRVPLDDKLTCDMLTRGETEGVSHLKFRGMRDLCRKFGIERLKHITALIALYRPGPMGLVPSFCDRKAGREPIEYEHPLLEPICRETYGMMIYQEQIMQAAQALAGYTLAAADLWRRPMDRKVIVETATQQDKFVKGCGERNNIPKVKAEQLFNLLEYCGGYACTKSHAATCALIAYQMAYLKAHYPAEFMAALPKHAGQ